MCLIIKDWIFCEIHIALILLACEGVGEIWENRDSDKTLRSQTIFEQAGDMARYSSSVEDLETLSYFL